MQQFTFLFCAFFLWFCSPESQPPSTNEAADWPAELNTAKDAGYLDELDKQVVLEINKVRSNPRKFSEDYMEELLTAFEGNVFVYPGQDPVVTKEGIRPLKECIQILKQKNPLLILQPSEGLSKASADLVADQEKYGGIGHIGHNGSTPQQRVEKYGEWNICLAEGITYGSFEARQIVIALLIDDGVPDRGHRNSILNDCFHFIGVAHGDHPDYKSMCVNDYAGEYKSR